MSATTIWLEQRYEGNLAARGENATMVPQLDVSMRYALGAQSKCRATVETLSVIENPPVFARPANISSGPQQVNNGPVVNGTAARTIYATAPNEPLEVSTHERMDGRTASQTSGSDSNLEAVAVINGTRTHAGIAKGANGHNYARSLGGSMNYSAIPATSAERLHCYGLSK
jgi:hypothetical protein